MQIFQTNTGEIVLCNKMNYKGMGAHKTTMRNNISSLSISETLTMLRIWVFCKAQSSLLFCY